MSKAALGCHSPPSASLVRVVCLLLATASPTASRAQTDLASNVPAPRVDALGDPLPPAALLRLGTLRFRHPSSLAEMALSPDGSTIISAGRGSLIAWDVDDGRERWRAKRERIQALDASSACYGQRLLAFSADSAHFYTPDTSGGLLKWDIANGQSELIPVPGEVAGPGIDAVGIGTAAVDVTRDGQTLAIGTARGVSVCTADGQLLFEIGNHPDQPVNLNGKDRLMFGGHFSYTRFSRDGKRLALVLSEKPQEIRLVNAQTGAEIRRISLGQRLVRLDFSPDDAQIVATERDNATRQYDVSTGERIWEHVIPQTNNAESYTCGVAFNPAGDLIAVCAPIGSDYGIRLLKADTGQQLAKLEGHTWKPWCVAFTADGSRLYSAGWDGPIRRWDVEQRHQLPLPQGVRAGGGVAASPDGRFLAYVNDAGAVHQIEIGSRAELPQLARTGAAFSHLRYSPDGRWLAGGGFDDEHLHVTAWNLESGEPRHWSWPKGDDPHADIEALDFHPDSGQLAVASFRQDKAYLIDLDNPDVLCDLRHPQVYGLSYSPDGRRVTTVGWDRKIRIWNASTGELLRTVDVTEPAQADLRMYGIDYAPVGGLVATNHMSGDVSLWTQDFELLKRFKTPGRFIYGALEFSPDGSLLATGEMSGQVTVWDPLTAEQVWNTRGHESYLYVVGFHPDGDHLFSSGSDGVGYLWDLAPEAPPTERSPEALWKALAGTSAEAYAASWELSRQPAESLPLLREKLPPIESLISLEVVASDVTGDEADRRKQLARLMAARDPAVELDFLVRRAIAVLVRIHSPEARELLQQLTGQHPESEIARQAEDALKTFSTDHLP